MVISNKVYFAKKGFKYFIGYKDAKNFSRKNDAVSPKNE